MKNLLNFFFSFDKLFKEKLIVPFFWLAIIYFGLKFLIKTVGTVKLDPLLWIIVPLFGLATILFTLVSVRIIAELVVAAFRINDNLSPDGGKSELVDIDPIEEARKAAELAAARTREATRSVSEKAGEATKSLRENVGEMSETVSGKAKAASASVREKAGDLKSKASKAAAPDPKPKPKPTATKTTSAEPAKKRGRPKGSTNKPKSTPTKKTTAKKTTTKSTGKRGPKPGSKIPRDKDGNLLKKDGTPRKKPGPKK